MTDETIAIRLHVNGQSVDLQVHPLETLVDLLRRRLHLTGTKIGCNVGECGACTVLLNGRPVNSCLVLAATIDGQEITTIEGLASDDRLDPIQESFVIHDASQCGFCTPGMIMAAKGLLDRRPEPSLEEVREALAGNLCRCTGYASIVRAVHAAAVRPAIGGRRAADREANKEEGHDADHRSEHADGT